MNLHNTLILSAGLGTRMGEIGTILPKPLWPIFKKTLIELQVDFVKSLGLERIFVNSHHQYLKMQKETRHLPLELVFEEKLLGTGGSIYNLARQFGLKGPLLYTVGDQFLFFPPAQLAKAVSLLGQYPCVLLGLEVEADSDYRRIVVENHLLKGLAPKESGYPLTFSGMALIDMGQLDEKQGPSGFFDTVANFQEKEIFVLTLKDVMQVDFGSCSRYFSQIFKLLEGFSNEEDSPVLNFFRRHGVFQEQDDKRSCTINLGQRKVENLGKYPAIILGQEGPPLKVKAPGIYFQDLFWPGDPAGQKRLLNWGQFCYCKKKWPCKVQEVIGV